MYKAILFVFTVTAAMYIFAGRYDGAIVSLLFAIVMQLERMIEDGGKRR